MHKIILVGTLLMLIIGLPSYAANSPPRQKTNPNQPADLKGDFYRSPNSRFFVLVNNSAAKDGASAIPDVTVFNSERGLLYRTSLQTTGWVTSAFISNDCLLLVNQHDANMEFGRKALLYDARGHKQWEYGYVSPDGDMMLSPNGRYMAISGGSKTPQVLSTDKPAALTLSNLPLMESFDAVFDSQDHLLIIGGSNRVSVVSVDIKNDRVLNTAEIAGENGEDVYVTRSAAASGYFSVSADHKTFAYKVSYPLEECGIACIKSGIVVFDESLAVLFNRQFPGKIPYVKLVEPHHLLVSLLNRGAAAAKRQATAAAKVLLLDIQTQRLILEADAPSGFIRDPIIKDNVLHYMQKSRFPYNWIIRRYDLQAKSFVDDANPEIPVGVVGGRLLMKDTRSNTISVFGK
jgi:hypothetical protein